MKAFVTGATGFIGSHLVRVLLEQGWQIQALRREGSSHPSFEVLPGYSALRQMGKELDWRIGDLRDSQSIGQAMAGCEVVFHVAADYRLWTVNSRVIYENNVQGTVNVLQAALSNRVERVVYTSSVGALGLNPDGTPADEHTPVCLEDMIGHYKRSKFLAEREAEKYFEKGLPVVVVHPSTPVGPGDHKPTPTGKIIVDFLNGQMPAYVDTGLNLIHVGDVAWGHFLALEKGRAGEKYILGNQNLALAEIFQLLEKISGIPSPRYRLPYTPILLLAYANEVFSRFTQKEPLIPLEGVKMARKHMFFNPAKAVRELGLPQTAIEEALLEAVAWFQENGYVGKTKRK